MSNPSGAACSAWTLQDTQGAPDRLHTLYFGLSGVFCRTARAGGRGLSPGYHSGCRKLTQNPKFYKITRSGPCSVSLVWSEIKHRQDWKGVCPKHSLVKTAPGHRAGVRGELGIPGRFLCHEDGIPQEHIPPHTLCGARAADSQEQGHQHTLLRPGVPAEGIWDVYLAVWPCWDRSGGG